MTSPTKNAKQLSKSAKKGTTADPKKLLILKDSHLFVVVDPDDLVSANETCTSKTIPFPETKLHKMKQDELIYTVYEATQTDGSKKEYAYLGKVTNIGKNPDNVLVLTITYFDYHERGPGDAIFDHWIVEDDQKEDGPHFYLVHQYNTKSVAPSKDQTQEELKHAIIQAMDRRMSSIDQQFKELESKFKASMEKITTNQKTNSNASVWAQPQGRPVRTEQEQKDFNARKEHLHANYGFDREEGELKKNKQGYYSETNTWAQNYPPTKTWPQSQYPYPTTEAQNTQVLAKEIPYQKNETNCDLRKIVEKIIEKKGLQPKGIVGVIDNDAIYPNEYKVRRALREGTQADPSRSPPVVIITFTTRQTKVKFLKGNKDAQGNYLDIKQNEIYSNGGDRTIYFSENLTKHQSTIFYKARQFKATHKWLHCWTKHGVVYLKKNADTAAQRIDDSEDLKQLEL
jgi:hypothetical protein